MKAYGRSWDYNVYACEYCLYHKSKKIGCVYEGGCCCPIPQIPEKRHGIFVKEPPAPKLNVSECAGCPYGRDSPCIGWCTKEALRFVGLLKERGNEDV